MTDKEQQYTLEAVIMSLLEIWGWNLVKIFIGHESILYLKVKKNPPEIKFLKIVQIRNFEIAVL